MEDEEITPTEDAVEVETADSTNSEEQEADESEVVTLEDYHKKEAANKALYQRAKKAEDELKKLKANKGSETPLKTNETSNGLTREEVILIAKGVSEDVINEAHDVARAKGITLSEAMKTPLISAFIKEKEAEEKRSKAQLGSSNYSGKTGSKDISQAVGMTEEEHRKSIGM